LAITLLGICWSAWERFHHVRDIPSELANGHVLHHEVLIRAQKYVLGPEEKKVWALPLRRPPDGQTSYITGHYKSNSVEGHLFLALGPEIHAPAGPPASWGNFEWEYWSHVCDIAKDPYLGSRKLVYSGGLGPRELSFGKKLEFGDDRMACFGVSIENQGKKSQAEFDVEIWLEYLVQ
jgi:hypothetical protein